MIRETLTILILSGVLILNCSTPLPNTPEHQGRKLYFKSDLIDAEDAFFVVYVPQKTDGPVPVVYLLNGGGQDPYGWETGADVQGAADTYGLILVSIATEGGFYRYRDDYVSGNLYESFVVQIVDVVDDLFDTKASREFRGISGYSMGADGSIYIGSRNPDKFISITSMSGGYSDTDVPDFENMKNQVFLMDCGRDDPAVETTRLIHQILLNNDVPHFYNEYTGGHTYAYMSQHFEEHISFHKSMFDLSK
ncbi:alpha/beta hydrolase [candidate division KSB1 bacterium]